MKTKRVKRSALTMLELIIATSMMAMLLSTVTVVMRTGRVAWEAHESDFTRLESAHATVRHIVRLVRQAKAITAISAATDPSGMLAIQMPNDDVWVWDHDAAADSVQFGQNTASSLLADNVTGLTFEAFRADGMTPTATLSEMQCLRVTASVMLPRDTNGSRSVTSWVWIRTWQ